MPEELDDKKKIDEKDDKTPEKKEEKKEVEGIDFEKIAKGKGWKPKTEFSGESWVDAEEFVKREPLFERIKQQSSDLKEMKKIIGTMADHYKKTQEVAVQKAIADLKTQKKEAIEVGDVAKVEQIDKEIEEHKQIKVDAPTTPEIKPEIKEWVEKNKWFDKNPKMQKFAISFNKTYASDNPEATLSETLKETEEAVKARFPEEFKTTSHREMVSSVESPSGGDVGSKKKGYGRDRLISDEQRITYDQVVKHKIMPPEEYVKGLEQIGELT
jgi:hypothetical protein